VIRRIPPTPRMVSSVSSGRPGSCQLCEERIESRKRKRNRTDYTPNWAFSAAYIISHIIASSNPPPRAEPATAAIMGLRIDDTADDKSFRYSCASFKFAPADECMCQYFQVQILTLDFVPENGPAVLLPVKTTTLTFISLSAIANAEMRLSINLRERAFFVSGWLMSVARPGSNEV
jgi:hypothetical protein